MCFSVAFVGSCPQGCPCRWVAPFGACMGSLVAPLFFGAVLTFGLCGSRAFPFGFCTPCFFVFCCGSWALPGLLGCFRRCRMSSFCFCCVLFVVFVCFTPILPWVSLVDPPVCPQAVWGDVQCTHSGRAVHFGLCLSTCMVKCGLAAGRHVGQCTVYLALGRPVRLRAWKHPWGPT
jgi:hypothetical protein